MAGGALPRTRVQVYAGQRRADVRLPRRHKGIDLSGIFISYRREDSSGYALRLFDSIASYFGRSQVFNDLDSIEAGTDF
jgi:hypothetical protein